MYGSCHHGPPYPWGVCSQVWRATCSGAPAAPADGAPRRRRAGDGAVHGEHVRHGVPRPPHPRGRGPRRPTGAVRRQLVRGTWSPVPPPRRRRGQRLDAGPPPAPEDVTNAPGLPRAGLRRRPRGPRSRRHGQGDQRADEQRASDQPARARPASRRVRPRAASGLPNPAIAGPPYPSLRPLSGQLLATGGVLSGRMIQPTRRIRSVAFRFPALLRERPAETPRKTIRQGAAPSGGNGVEFRVRSTVTTPHGTGVLCRRPPFARPAPGAAHSPRPDPRIPYRRRTGRHPR